MARSDLQVYLAAMRTADEQMTAMFDGLAREIGQVVLRYAGPDGTVPVERIQDVQREARRLVSVAILGGPGRQPFDEQNTPRSEYARIIAEGQRTMIDMALSRQSTLLQQRMPEDVAVGLRRKWLARGAGL